MKHLLLIFIFLVSCQAQTKITPKLGVLSPKASLEVSKATHDDSKVVQESSQNSGTWSVNINNLEIGGAGVVLALIVGVVGYLWIKKSRYYKVAKLLVASIERTENNKKLKESCYLNSKAQHVDKPLAKIVKSL